MKIKKTIIISLAMYFVLILGMPVHATNNTAFTRGSCRLYTSLSTKAPTPTSFMLDYKTPIAITGTVKGTDFYRAKVYFNGKIRNGYIRTYHVRNFTANAIYHGKTVYSTHMTLTNGKLKFIPINTAVDVKYGKGNLLYSTCKIGKTIYKGYIYVLAVRLN